MYISKLLCTGVLLMVLIHSVNYATTINVPGDYSTIQEALNNASSGDNVLVAAGTYTENIFWPNVNGVILEGTAKESTIINGSKNGTVIIIFPISANINNATIVRNLTITNGGNSDNGGGLMVVNSSPLIQNIIIDNNSALKGAGIYLKNSNSEIKSCSIKNNSTTSLNDYGEGGGVYINGGYPKLNSCTISDNNSRRGAGVYLIDGKTALDESTLIGNIATQNGGGIYTSGDSNCQISNSSINENRGPNLGGGLCNYGGTCIIENSILNNNFSYNGGGIYHSYSGYKTIVRNSYILNHSGAFIGAGILSDNEIEVENSVIAYNNANSSDGSEGGGILVKNNGKATIIGVSFIDNNATKAGGGLSISENTDLIVQDCTFYHNSSNDGDAIYVNGLSSHSINNNNFYENGVAFFNDDNTVYIDASNNYWGDNSGPLNTIQNVNGLGDATNTFVNVTPWLTQTAPPFPVDNVTVIDYGSGYVSLSWGISHVGKLGDDSSISVIAGYKIYYDTDNEDFPYRFSIDAGNVTTFTIDNITATANYYFAVVAYDSDGNESWFTKANESVYLATKASVGIPSKYYLSNFPNPFNPTTTIHYTLPEDSQVSIVIHDLLGKKVAQILSSTQPSGTHSIKWNGTDQQGNLVPAGIYFYQLQAGDFVQTKKMVLMK